MCIDPLFDCSARIHTPVEARAREQAMKKLGVDGITIGPGTHLHDITCLTRLNAHSAYAT